MNVTITVNETAAPAPAAVRRIAVGDRVYLKNGESFVVKGYLLGVYYPTVGAIREVVEPLYPKGSEVYVVRLEDVVGYEDLHTQDGYGNDSIFWGT